MLLELLLQELRLLVQMLELLLVQMLELLLQKRMQMLEHQQACYMQSKLQPTKKRAKVIFSCFYFQ